MCTEILFFTARVRCLPDSRAESAVAGAPVELESRARASEARLPCSSSLARSCKEHMTCCLVKLGAVLRGPKIFLSAPAPYSFIRYVENYVFLT
jgi:hypothetical protein